MIQATLLGRLGNQMFIYAAMRIMALECGCKLKLTQENIKKNNVGWRLGCFNLSTDVTIVSDRHFNLKQRVGYFIYMLMCRHKTIARVYELEKRYQRLFHHFGLILNQEGYIKPLPLEKRNWYALGYFQCDKYFSKYEELIHQEFSFRPELLSDETIALGDEIRTRNSVCLHIRMGDYMKDPVFGVCGLDYYHRALQKMITINPTPEVYVFSDDIEQAKIVLQDMDNISFHYIDSMFTDQESLYLGTCCRHFIMSNSTFSWWMQYLSDNKDKIVLAPNRWYNTPNPCDIYQDNWMLIEA